VSRCLDALARITPRARVLARRARRRISRAMFARAMARRAASWIARATRCDGIFARALEFAVGRRGVAMGTRAARDARDAGRRRAVDDARRAIGDDAREAEAARSRVVFEEEVLPALRAFYAERGHLNVPRAYVVPSDAPAAIAGMKLGNRVDRIRYRGDFVKGSEERMKALDAVGEATGETFAWDGEDWVFYKQIIPCLRYYIKEHGHGNVPMAYETPRDARAYSSANALKTYNMGFALGKRVNDIRAKGTFVEGRPDRFDALSKMQFVWDDEEFNWSQRLIPALQLYEQVHGHLNVPSAYAVPAKMPCPFGVARPVVVRRDLVGFELGSAVAQIRHWRFQRPGTSEGAARSRVRQLDRLSPLGFPWDVAEWERRARVLKRVRRRRVDARLASDAAASSSV
jgi:hypothetical protein